MSVLVVHNPVARVSQAEVERLLRAVAPDEAFSIVQTAHGEEIAGQIAGQLDGISVVVAVGGDGTVSETASVLMETGIPLGIIPAGTTNMLARVNGVPSDPRGAVELIFGRHRLENIDAGVAGKRVLLHLGGAGLDAKIFERSDPALKRRYRWLGYAPAALRSLGDPSFRVTVTVDGNTVCVPSRFVLIANSGALIHPKFTILPTASRTDGVFDVGIFLADSWPAIARTALELPLSRWRDSSNIVRMQGKEISVAADPPVPYEFDGDVIGMTPFQLSVRQRAVIMICGA